MINARKINDEKNIFDGIFTNPMFLIIWFIVIIGQVIIVEFTGIVFHVCPGGLPWEHWVIAIILGFTSWIWSFILKLLPDAMCP